MKSSEEIIKEITKRIEQCAYIEKMLSHNEDASIINVINVSGIYLFADLLRWIKDDDNNT